MRVLFLTYRLPYAPNRSDHNRAYHLLQHMRSFAEVDLVSFVHSRAEVSRTPDVAEFAPSVRIVLAYPCTRINCSGAASPTSGCDSDAVHLLPCALHSRCFFEFKARITIWLIVRRR